MPNSRPRKLTPKAIADWAKNAAVVFVEFNGVLMRKSIERRGGGSAHQSCKPGLQTSGAACPDAITAMHAQTRRFAGQVLDHDVMLVPTLLTPPPPGCTPFYPIGMLGRPARQRVWRDARRLRALPPKGQRSSTEAIDGLS